MFVPAIVEVVAGLVVSWVGIRMWQGRVKRGLGIGVRTPSTLHSDAAFAAANKAAAPVTCAGGAVMAVCGVFAAAVPRHLVGAFIFGGVGVFLIMCILGAAVGVRAARPVR